MVLILALFLVVRSFEAAGHLSPLAASFADDLLCLPLVLGAVLFFHRRIAKQGEHYILPLHHGLLTLALFSIFFEGILPNWNSAAVADPWDLLMYLVGYLVFEAIMNQPAGKTRWRNCRDSV